LEIDSLGVTKPTKDSAQLSPTFRLAPHAAGSVVEEIQVLPDEVETLRFLTELAFSFANIKRDDRGAAAMKDATFSNPAVSDNRIRRVERSRGIGCLCENG
jgi:hypothetical protein